MASLKGLTDEIAEICKLRFSRFEINKKDIEHAVRHILNNHGCDGSVDKLPAIVDGLLNHAAEVKRTLNFTDVVDFCYEINRSGRGIFDALHARYFYPGEVDVNSMNVLEFADFVYGRGIDVLCELSKRYPMPNEEFRFDTAKLPEDRKRLFSYWKYSSEGEYHKPAHRFLIEKQAESGSFRAWLEAQTPTVEIKDEFEKLGLDYSAWDNPNAAFGYKGKLEEIVCDGEKAKEAARDLTRKLTRGEFIGCLTASPKQVFKAIGAIYKGMETAEDVQALLLTLQQYVAPKHLSQGRLAKEFKMVEALATGANPELAGKDYDFVFRTWRRQPSYDFCEGNDSGICTAFNGTSGEAMINYLVDRAVSLVDIVHKGRRHGQIYMFGAVDENKRPILIVDSLEVGNNDSIEEKSQDLYVATEGVVKEIGRRAGFKSVLVSGTLYWRHSSAFLDYLMHKYGRRHDHKEINWFGERVQVVDPAESDFDKRLISKIGNTRAVKNILGNLNHDSRYVGRKHYFDIYGVLGQEDNLDWKENCDNYLARGLLLNVD
ncbi:hypothetical protein HYT23_01275 [Candidatus Pacearchaeota archaeon]|nr:hypothetical protein [Candidatus Pacearchaeota archaeon]